MSTRDRLGYGRQRLPGLVLPEESLIQYGYLVCSASPLAEKTRTRLEKRPFGLPDITNLVEVLGEAPEFGGDRLLETAEGFLLDPPGNAEFEQITPDPIGWAGAELFSPEGDEIVAFHGGKSRQLLGDILLG